MAEGALEILPESLPRSQSVGAVVGKCRKNSALRQCPVNLVENRGLQACIENSPGKAGENSIWTRNIFRIQMIAQARCAAFDDSGFRKFARDFSGENRTFFNSCEVGSTRQVGKYVAGKRPAARAEFDDAGSRM